MSHPFKEIKGNFGFGIMRLPLDKNQKVNLDDFQKLVDYFMNNGFNYFDTARVYLAEDSEKALKACLTSRYKREDFVLTNKLSSSCFSKKEDIIPFFNSQLEACGVDYFDFYLMHAQSRNNYEQYQKSNAYKVASELKKEGKIKHLGISFHDSAEFLEKILLDHPEIEVVQLQFNYLDYDSEDVQSKLCYEVCKKYNKPVIVMEPVKGGRLVNLPDEADKLLRELNNGTNASYAIRFAASFDNVFMVLSGMSNMEQLKDNVSFMKNFTPLSENEFKVLDKVVEIFNKIPTIPCTSCKYCVDGCPKTIKIPDLFSIYNNYLLYKEDQAFNDYKKITLDSGKASDCIKCAKCEKICPQHLKIRDFLVNVKDTLER